MTIRKEKNYALSIIHDALGHWAEEIFDYQHSDVGAISRHWAFA
jgi:hypothetical protein